ncbi:MAG: type III-B CRISPR module RAMP protein Cmr6 [Acidobacteriota bacterium]
MPIRMSLDVSALLGPKAQKCSNLSLLADKFPDLSDPDEKDEETRARFVRRLLDVKSDPAWKDARLGFPHAIGARATTSFQARLQGRLIVNQAGGVVENAGLCLDRHFGVPYIPGSALKGISRAAALESTASASDLPAILAVFGWGAADPYLKQIDAPSGALSSGFAGSVSFLPAYPTGAVQLCADIVTCHHPDYYRSDDSSRRALDIENPIPNIFPAVETGCDFVFVLALCLTETRMRHLRKSLSLPAEFDPLQNARDWLILALTDHGAGAKTAAGYGWFQFDAEAEARRDQAREKEREQQERLRRQQQARAERLAGMTPVERAREQISGLGDEAFSHFARELDGKSEPEQRAFFQVLRTERASRLKMWKKKRSSRWESIRKVAENLGEEL